MGTIAPPKLAGPVQKEQVAPSSRVRIPNIPAIPALLLVIAAAAVLRFHALGNRGFWLDETLSATFSQGGSSTLLQTLRREIDMALYFVLLHFWMMLGNSEYAIRAMSVVFSVLTIPFTYALGSRLFGRNAGLIAAGLLAFNAYHIRYAQEARSYALVVLLATFATWLLVRNLQEPRNALWSLYGVSLALMVYSHLLSGLLIVITHYVAICFLPPRTIPWKGLLRSTAWLGCLLVPMAILFPISMANSNPVNWVQRLDWSSVLHFLVLAAGNKGYLLLALEGVMVAAVMFTLAHAWLQQGRALREQRLTEAWPFVLVLLWFFLPIAILLGASLLRPVFVPRYLLPCLPALVLTVAAGLVCIRPRSIAWTLGGAIFVLSMAGISSCYNLKDVIEDWRTISAGILDQAKPGDVVAFYPEYSRTPFDYYRGRRRPAPEWPIEVPANTFDAAVTDQLRPSNFQLLGGETQTPQPTNRIWMIFHHPNSLSIPERKSLKENLDFWRREGWSLRDVREFPDVTVLLFAASPDGAVPVSQLPNLFQFRATPPALRR